MDEGAGPSSGTDESIYDPGAAVHGEVTRGVDNMIKQHTEWLELLAAGQKGGEEYDWRTAELLSCLRSIEWDLQDLEDHLSIVEGNREKYVQLGDSFITSRKELIVRAQRAFPPLNFHNSFARVLSQISFRFWPTLAGGRAP